MSCIFCDIVSGKLPGHIIYEDEKVMAFLDIGPVHYGHTLVITKEHYVNFEDIPEDLLCEAIKLVKKVGFAIKEGIGRPGYNVQVNNDPVAGQIIPHVHFHIIPRKKGDGLRLWPQHEYEKGDAEVVSEKMRKTIEQIPSN